MTTNAAMYLRVSLDPTGKEDAVTRQREDCLEIIKRRGWRLAGEYVDNSISASDSRKVRPGYDALCQDYEAGKFGALVCYDLDRLTRQPRQLEDWIDAAERHGLVVVTANGEADLSTDGGILFAGIKLQVARSEVRRKGARQRRAHRQRAERGQTPKGTRLTGYTTAGKVIEQEARVVRRIFDRFAAGDSLLGIATGLTADGIKTRRGGRWSSSTVRTILINPRYMGRIFYDGEDVAKALSPALVDEATFAAVADRLNDPRRITNHADTARKHLGSGVYVCGRCGKPMRASSGNGPTRPRYTCKSMCFYRSGAPIDDFVTAVIRGRLALPDLGALLTRPVDKSAQAHLAGERERLQARLAAFERDYDEGNIDGRRYKAATGKTVARIAAIRAEEHKLVAVSAKGSVIGADDPVAAFDTAPLAIKQRTINALATITLHPGKHGSHTLDPDTIIVEWLTA